MDTLSGAPQVDAEVSPSPKALSRPGARWLGIGCGVASALLLGLALNRSYDLDSSITVGAFVMTPSIADAFTKSYLLNNHVFMSFVEHLVYTLTGSSSEPTMHVLPIVFAASAVGTLAWEIGRRLSILAGLCAAAVLVTNPLFADLAPEVRGYSLLMLCGVVTTVAILPTVLDDTPTPSPARRVLYTVVAAIGLATHLYMVWILVGHVLLVATRPSRLRAWVIPWLAGGTLGAVAYLWILKHMLDTGRDLGRLFRAGFPLDAGEALLGGSVLLAVLVGALLVPGLWTGRRNRVTWAAVLAVILPVVTMWLLAPFDLYPRFFVWLVPVIAVGIAASIAFRPVMAIVVVLVVGLQLVVSIPLLTENPFANRTAHEIFTRVRKANLLPCTVDDYTTLRMLGYGFNFRIAVTQGDMRHCAVIATMKDQHQPGEPSLADREFRYRTRLDARQEGLLWSRVPGKCWLTEHPSTAACREP